MKPLKNACFPNVNFDHSAIAESTKIAALPSLFMRGPAQ
jgi:hypothetical protein